MIRFLIVLIITVAPVAAAYSGTFYDGFDDGNLDGWEVCDVPHCFPPRLENGYLVLDTMINGFAKAKNVWMTLRAGDAQNWDSYTLRCKVRFSSESHRGGDLTILVRLGGWHDAKGCQFMNINSRIQHVYVSTIPPGAEIGINEGDMRPIKRGEIRGDQLRRHIALDRWYSIKIVAEQQFFEFFFDDNLVSKYVDHTAVPGTVMFKPFFGTVAHLDDVTITGPRVPDINSSHVSPNTSLATTWGEIKIASRQ